MTLLSCVDILNALNCQFQHTVKETPPFSGESIKDEQYGEAMRRGGKVVICPKGITAHSESGICLSEDDNIRILESYEFLDDKTFIKPKCHKGLLSNPLRKDGLALDKGYYVMRGFTGHLPVYTQGNWWPNIPSNEQPQPPHDDYHWHAGLYFVNGHVAGIEESSPTLYVRGADNGGKLENQTPYHMIITSVSYPGNGFPGQNLQILPAMHRDTGTYSCAVLPTPPIGILFYFKVC